MTENQPTTPATPSYNQPLAPAKKPGETPTGMEAYVNAARLRILQIKNPALYQRYMASQINHTPLSDEDALIIFGSSGVVAI